MQTCLKAMDVHCLLSGASLHLNVNTVFVNMQSKNKAACCNVVISSFYLLNYMSLLLVTMIKRASHVFLCVIEQSFQ
jgi:hypothetical protein